MREGKRERIVVREECNQREKRIVGIVLVQQECGLRPKLGRQRERKRNGKRDGRIKVGGAKEAFWVECA